MANVYSSAGGAIQGTAEQVRMLICDVTVQLTAGTVITVVPTNSVPCALSVVAFTNVASGAAANTTTTTNAGSTSPALTTPLSSSTSGDIVLGVFCANASPTVSAQLDNSAGNTMTQVETPLVGQSRTGWAQWLVESVAAVYGPRATLGSSQAWAAFAARFNNNGSAITKIASSNNTAAWAAAGLSFTISPGTTIPVGSKLYVFVYTAANSGTVTATDNATGNVSPTVTGNPSITGTARRGQTLTCVDGTATGTPSPTVSARQWKRNGSDIGGATGTTYALVAADDGATITVAVTWTNTAGSATGTSTATTNVSEARTAVAQDARIEFCGNSMIVTRNDGLVVFTPGASGPLTTQVDTIAAAHIVPVSL